VDRDVREVFKQVGCLVLERGRIGIDKEMAGGEGEGTGGKEDTDPGEEGLLEIVGEMDCALEDEESCCGGRIVVCKEGTDVWKEGNGLICCAKGEISLEKEWLDIPVSEEKQMLVVPAKYRIEIIGIRVTSCKSPASIAITSSSMVASSFNPNSFPKVFQLRSTELASVALCMIQEKENQFDLVMADTEMKEMDIFTFLNRILTKRDMPIIFMSLDENMEMARKALNEGACFFLQKPIRRRDIANVWQHVFRKRTSSQKIENCKAFIEEKEVPNKDSCREKIIKVDGLCKIVAINDFQGREKGRLTTNKGIEDDEQKEDDPMKTDEMSILQDIFKEQIVNIEKGKQRESNIIQGINTMKKDSRGGKIEEVGRLPRVSIGSGLLGISNENLPTNRRGKRIEIDREPGLEWRNRAKELSRITQIASMEMGNQGLSSRKRGNNDNDGRSRERRDLERSNYSKGLRSFENGSERKYTDNSSREKRLRMKWTPALHIKFMEAISALGDRKAHPKSVLRIMNEPNLTVRHVASHLQVFKDYHS
ncbi:hypothetical protein U1Q18_029612, partial [Sarracenia purpurea var. burkii]